MMRKPFAVAALIGTLIAANVMAMDQSDFTDYVWGRAGDGGIIHRVSIGTAYDIESGKLLARVEGHEVAMAVPSMTEPGTVYHIARAMLLYRDPVSNAVLAVYPGSDPDALTGVSAYSHVDGDFVWRLGSPANDTPPRTVGGAAHSQKMDRDGSPGFCDLARGRNWLGQSRRFRALMAADKAKKIKAKLMSM